MNRLIRYPPIPNKRILASLTAFFTIHSPLGEVSAWLFADAVLFVTYRSDMKRIREWLFCFWYNDSDRGMWEKTQLLLICVLYYIEDYLGSATADVRDRVCGHALPAGTAAGSGYLLQASSHAKPQAELLRLHTIILKLLLTTKISQNDMICEIRLNLIKK